MRGIAWILPGVAVVALIAVMLVAGGREDGSGPADRGGEQASGKATSSRSAPRKVSGSHTDPVPILMYHVISDPPSDVPFPDLFVSPTDFKRQIDALAANGYHGVTLDRVDDHWRKGYALPSKPLVVSFDDGYDSQSTKAFPIMEAHDWPGVVNLAVKNLSVAGGLKPAQVRRLIAAGWEIDAHTINHVDVTTLDAAGYEREIAGSRKAIQRRFGEPVNFFCYPSGRFDDAAVAAVRRAGFKGATTTEPGLARPSDPYRLARVRVNRGDSPQAVLSAVH